MQITKETIARVDQEYLTFLGDMYIYSKDVPKEAIEWFLSELALTISIVHPDFNKDKVIELLINLQKLKRISKKKREI